MIAPRIRRFSLCDFYDFHVCQSKCWLCRTVFSPLREWNRHCRTCVDTPRDERESTRKLFITGDKKFLPIFFIQDTTSFFGFLVIRFVRRCDCVLRQTMVTTDGHLTLRRFVWERAALSAPLTWLGTIRKSARVYIFLFNSRFCSPFRTTFHQWKYIIRLSITEQDQFLSNYILQMILCLGISHITRIVLRHHGSPLPVCWHSYTRKRSFEPQSVCITDSTYYRFWFSYPIWENNIDAVTTLIDF